jgi:outer membrane protein assembly factor BamB
MLRDGVQVGWTTAPDWPLLYGGVALGVGGVIYAAGKGGLYACDVTGSPVWSYTADSAGAWQPFIGSPAIAPDGTVHSYEHTCVCVLGQRAARTRLALAHVAARRAACGVGAVAESRRVPP